MAKFGSIFAIGLPDHPQHAIRRTRPTQKILIMYRTDIPQVMIPQVMISDLKPDRTWHSESSTDQRAKSRFRNLFKNCPTIPQYIPIPYVPEAFLDMGYLRRYEGFDEGLYVDPASAAAQVLQ